MAYNSRLDANHFNAFGQPFLPGYLSVRIDEVGEGFLRGHLDVQAHHLAPNGYLHAATVISLADTACGYACFAHLPEDAGNFTTIELKANFIGTVREGAIACEARAVHLGRTTQLWEARVIDGSNGKLIAVFQCTQMVLRKRQ
jgi:1,4-dihydroxy-2-naphthoyl-CoA hydrolase